MGKTRRQLLEEAAVFVEEYDQEMVPLDVALNVMEVKEDAEFEQDLGNLKKQMQELDRLFDDLNREIND